jgi:hypothetical protein
MPSWLKLALFIFACTMVAPLFVLGNTASPRAALGAWWFFARYLLALAVPTIIVSGLIWLSR